MSEKWSIWQICLQCYNFVSTCHRCLWWSIRTGLWTLPDIFGLKTGNTIEKSLQTIKVSMNMLQDSILPLTSLLQGKHFNEKWTVVERLVWGGGLLKMGEGFPTEANRDVLLCANYYALYNIDRGQQTDMSAFTCEMRTATTLAFIMWIFKIMYICNSIRLSFELDFLNHCCLTDCSLNMTIVYGWMLLRYTQGCADKVWYMLNEWINEGINELC